MTGSTGAAGSSRTPPRRATFGGVRQPAPRAEPRRRPAAPSVAAASRASSAASPAASRTGSSRRVRAPDEAGVGDDRLHGPARPGGDGDGPGDRLGPDGRRGRGSRVRTPTGQRAAAAAGVRSAAAVPRAAVGAGPAARSRMPLPRSRWRVSSSVSPCSTQAPSGHLDVGAVDHLPGAGHALQGRRGTSAASSSRARASIDSGRGTRVSGQGAAHGQPVGQVVDLAGDGGVGHRRRRSGSMVGSAAEARRRARPARRVVGALLVARGDPGDVDDEAAPARPRRRSSDPDVDRVHARAQAGGEEPPPRAGLGRRRPGAGSRPATPTGCRRAARSALVDVHLGQGRQGRRSGRRRRREGVVVLRSGRRPGRGSRR